MNLKAGLPTLLYKMDKSLQDKVYKLVAKIPKGKVATYGQIALLCGHPGAARAVGQIAHFGPTYLPWHRVIKANGLMATGFVPGGPNHQAQLLMQEGVEFKESRVIALEKYLWKMPNK